MPQGKKRAEMLTLTSGFFNMEIHDQSVSRQNRGLKEHLKGGLLRCVEFLL